MIASTSSGRIFSGLGRYLARGRWGGEAHRVAWAEALHLPTRDPELAAKYMQAAAQANTRVEKPVYHVALAFHPDDPVTPAMMRQAAHRLLADIGLEGHQAVIVAHQDRDHPHVHLMVNRVHPDTGRVWDRSHDYRRIETSLRAQERELGVRIVPGRHAAPPALAPDRACQREPDDTDRQPLASAVIPARSSPRGIDVARSHPDVGDRSAPATKGEVRQALRTAEMSLIDRARAQVAVFRESATWDALTERLGAHGLRVVRKGQGLVVTDGATAVKASRVARDCALAQLEARLGITYDRWAAERAPRPERESVPTPSRALARTPEQDDSRGTTSPDHTPHTSSPVRGVQPSSRVEENPMATTVPLETEVPEAARRRFEPDELSRLSRVLTHVERTIDDPHRVNPELARPLAEQTPGARFVARCLDQYEQVLQASVTATTARETFGQARDAVEDGIAAGRAATAAEARFKDALSSVYQDPVVARQEFDKASAQVGLEKATDMLRQAPELYGKLNTVDVPERKLFSTVVREDDRVARAGADLAADLAGRAATARAAAPTAEQVTRQLDAMHRAEAQAVRAEATLAQLPRGDELARSVARGVARLDDRAFAELETVLPVHRAELADTFRDATVQVLARESAGRVQHLREQLSDRSGVVLPGSSTPTAEQRGSATVLHGEATRALLDGRDLARALGAAPGGGDLGRPEAGIGGTTMGDRGVGVRGAAQEAGGVGRGSRDDVGAAASPRARGQAADQSGRAVHQAIQALTPEEIQALTTAVRAGAQLAVNATVGLANMVARDVTSVQQAVRAGVGRALAAREVER